MDWTRVSFASMLRRLKPQVWVSKETTQKNRPRNPRRLPKTVCRIQPPPTPINQTKITRTQQLIHLKFSIFIITVSERVIRKAQVSQVDTTIWSRAALSSPIMSLHSCIRWLSSLPRATKTRRTQTSLVRHVLTNVTQEIRKYSVY